MFDDTKKMYIASTGTIIGAALLVTFLSKNRIRSNIKKYNENEKSPFEIVYYDECYGDYIMREKSTNTMYIKSDGKYTQILDENGKPLAYGEWNNTNKDTQSELENKNAVKESAFEVVLENDGVQFLREKGTNAMYLQSGGNRTPMLGADGEPLSYEAWAAANQ